jgi:hypothetical protein
MGNSPSKLKHFLNRVPVLEAPAEKKEFQYVMGGNLG